jgi:hypothetical protein
VAKPLNKTLNAEKYGPTIQASISQTFIKDFAGKLQVLEQQSLNYGARAAALVVCVVVVWVSVETLVHILRKQLLWLRDVLSAAY